MFLCVQVPVAGANGTNGVWSVTYSRLTSYGLRFLHCSLWRAAWNLCDRIVAKKGCEPTSKGAKWLLCWSSQQVQAPRTTVLVMRSRTCWYLIFYDVGREIFFAWYGGEEAGHKSGPCHCMLSITPNLLGWEKQYFWKISRLQQFILYTAAIQLSWIMTLPYLIEGAFHALLALFWVIHLLLFYDYVCELLHVQQLAFKVKMIIAALQLVYLNPLANMQELSVYIITTS